jgi:hypothetical protein
MSVAQGLLALQDLLGQQVVHKAHRDPKASQVLQGQQEPLEHQGHEACKAFRVCQDRQGQQAQQDHQDR